MVEVLSQTMLFVPDTEAPEYASTPAPVADVLDMVHRLRVTVLLIKVGAHM
jgi:hypothetical protein